MPNSIYGKLAQSKGSARFNSWVWAGNITSGTRAQLLTAICAAKDPWNVLMVATDGVFSTEELRLPAPRDTGTDIDVFDTSAQKMVRKPLGGWEHKQISRGIFLARPGIYFPLDPTDADIKEMRARGVSKSVLVKHAAKLIEWWNTTPQQRRLTEPFQIGLRSESCYDCQNEPDCAEHMPLVRFVGMKTGILPGGSADRPYKRLSDEGAALVGEWVDNPIALSLAPTPKRQGAHGQTLLPWAKVAGMSGAYSPAIKSSEGAALAAAEEEMMEQPGGDWVET